jgi:hypothetical protein
MTTESLSVMEEEEVATIDYCKIVRGAVVGQSEWLELTADELRQAIAKGDLIVIRQDDGQYLAADGRECHDSVGYAGSYWRPSGAID